MNAAHLHLIVNHAPLYGLIGGIALLFWGVVANSPDVRLAARVVLVIAAFAGLAAYFTGESAQRTIENLPRVVPSRIERHQDIATFALVGMLLTGILAAAGMAMNRASARMKSAAIAALFLTSLVSLAITGYAANLGGKIRHVEVRSPVSMEER